MYLKTAFILLLTCLSLATGFAKKEDEELKKFEKEAWALRTDLVHNHTYDLSNLRKADSLYNKSIEMGSVLGKLYALQIRTYALVGNGKTEQFLRTVDEYRDLALENKRYDEYFDAESAKTQYLMGQQDYSKALFEAKDMVATAEKVHSLNGLYESNLLIGQIYKYRGSWYIAEKHLKKALDAINKTGQNDSIPYCLIYREMAECYSGAKKHDLAIEYSNKAKEWAPFDVYRYFAECTYLVAIFNTNDMKRFRNEYHKSELNTPKLKEILPDEMAIPLLVMVHTANGEYDEAIRLEKEYEGNNNYNTLAAIAYQQGDYKQAYDYINKQLLKADSIETLLQQDDLSEMEARLGNAMLQNETREAKEKQRQTLIISVGFLLIFVICAMYYMLKRGNKLNKELVNAQAITEGALKKAEQANAMRSHFIENMMHEIRTPLNAISGFTQILTAKDITVEEEDAAMMRDVIMENTTNLTTMLNQIIHLSSLDSGSEPINMVEVETKGIIHKAIEQCNNRQKGVDIIIKSDNPIITTDPILLEEALAILLHNAGKFTALGTITVQTQTTDEDIILSVTDTGIGIAPDMAEKIFERFFKVDEFIPGTGLGLALCRAIVTALGGTVILDTTHEDQGARFVITLPKKP